MSDRIKLAEAMNLIRLLHAMGWTHAEEHSDNPEWRGMWFTPDGGGPMPQPKLDANFDYAVLEWMREQPPKEHTDGLYLYCPFIEEMEGRDAMEYEIGDYARAALKVLEQANEQ